MNTFETIILMIVSGLIGGSVSYYFSEKIENHKFLQLQRQKAEAISHLFAMWIKYRGKESEILNKREQFDYYEELNKMSIEISLWIGDDKLLTDIMALLENKPDAKSIRNLIGEVRKLVLGHKKENFDFNNVIIWPRQELLDDLLNTN